MRTGYDILLSLAITHPYFLSKDPDGEDGYKEVFGDFELVPDKKTIALIKAMKLIPKKNDNTWNLFFQTEGPFATTVDSLINKEFYFEIKINNSTFYMVTNEDYLHGKDEMLWFNYPIDSIMVPEKRGLCPLQFDYAIHHTVRPVMIKVTTAKGTDIINETITDVTVEKKEIDLAAYGENIYNINEDTVPPGSLKNEKIFAKEARDGGAFYGIVFFKVLPVDVNSTANNFKINIKGK
jgi:hypothetical protein